MRVIRTTYGQRESKKKNKGGRSWKFLWIAKQKSCKLNNSAEYGMRKNLEAERLDSSKKSPFFPFKIPTGLINLQTAKDVYFVWKWKLKSLKNIDFSMFIK